MIDTRILKEIYYCLTGALVIFGLLELAWPRLILAYLNLNWVLILWFIIAIVILVVDNNSSDKK